MAKKMIGKQEARLARSEEEHVAVDLECVPPGWQGMLAVLWLW